MCTKLIFKYYLACIIHTVTKGVITLLGVKELKPILRESYNNTIGFNSYTNMLADNSFNYSNS